MHHYGFVRHAARLREKWRNQQGKVYGTGSFRLPRTLFKWFPHRWEDPDFLPYLRLYDGPAIEAVRLNPGEFVRDDFRLYHLLSKTTASAEPFNGTEG